MNASTPLPSVVAASVLPTTTTLIPAGIALAVLTPLTIIIDLPPLIWHVRNRNTAAASLVGWIVLHNFLAFLNLLIWPTDDFDGRYVGQGLCDVEVKLQVARAVALPAASLCIVRALANVMNTNKSLSVPTKTQRRRAIILDLVYCFGLPLIMMFFHYIVQPNRYFLAGVSGCTPSFYASWLSIVLLNVPPLILSLANAYYAGLVLWRLHKYSAAFRNIMASSNTTKSRFFRLFAISFVLAVGLLPVEIYVLTTNLPALKSEGAFSWSAVHNSDTWRTIVLYHSAVFYDRWVDVGCGFLVFVFFGMGRDAKKMYCTWLCACGLGKVFPALKTAAGQRSRNTTVQSSYSSRARMNNQSKLGSSVSKDTTTFESKNDFGPASPTDSITQLSKPVPASHPTRDPFSFLDDEHNRATAPRSLVSRLTAPFKRSSTASGDAVKLHRIPFSAASQSGHGEIRSMVSGQHDDMEALTYKGMLPDKEVLVRKEIRRSSESI